MAHGASSLEVLGLELGMKREDGHEQLIPCFAHHVSDGFSVCQELRLRTRSLGTSNGFIQAARVLEEKFNYLFGENFVLNHPVAPFVPSNVRVLPRRMRGVAS